VGLTLGTDRGHLTPFFSLFHPSTSIKTRAGALTNRLPLARWSPENGDVADDNGKHSGCASPSFAGGHYGRTRFQVKPRPPPRARHRSGDSLRRQLRCVRAVLRPPSPMRLNRRHCLPRLRPSNFAPQRLAVFWKLHAETRFVGWQSCPLLPIAKELRRIKRREDLEEFERFQEAYGKAVWEEVLKARREAESNPELASQLDGWCAVSKPGLQNSLGTILRGTPSGGEGLSARLLLL
jgi:hypothetical protein